MSVDSGEVRYASVVDSGYAEAYALSNEASMDRYVTRAVDPDDPLDQPLRDRLASVTGRGAYAPVTMLLTTEFCWSGYSEFTVTSTWQQVVVTVPEWNFERSFEGVALFLRWLLDGDQEETA